MDSVTQLLLGAAVGEATLGRKVGNKAPLWGAIAGTLPDLDVFIPLGGVVEDFTYHRSASHSLFVLALLTPLMVWLIGKLHPGTRTLRRRWLAAIYLVFASHVLLDSFTAYGTQILWPLATTPIAWASIFIIDPSYTLPLLVGVLAALCMTRKSNRGHLINRYGLIVSTLYLGWTVAAKLIVEHRFETALDARQLDYERIFVTPAPFNSLLWRGVARTENAYYEGYYSLFDGDAGIRIERYPSSDGLIAAIEDHWPVARLRWFSHGFYSVSQQRGDIIISDLRMGSEPDYVFRFKVAELANPHPRLVVPEQLQTVRDWGLLPVIWARIWDPEITLSPP